MANMALPEHFASDELDLTTVYEEQADFVWRNLQRCGVSERDLPDMLQEVFLVVHRRRKSLRSKSSLQSWIFGICLRVAKNCRKKAHRRRERLIGDSTEVARVADRRRQTSSTDETRLQVHRILDSLKPERRSILIMFEVEGLSCSEIAEIIGVKTGTVHSRLHRARRDFVSASEKQDLARRDDDG